MSTFYAMRESLAIVSEEGLSATWERHRRLHHHLWDGLKGMGLQPFVEKESDRLVTINCIKVGSIGSTVMSVKIDTCSCLCSIAAIAAVALSVFNFLSHMRVYPQCWLTSVACAGTYISGVLNKV